MSEVSRISDNFANDLLKTLDGRGGSVVTDSYRLSKGDIALLSDYPVKSYSSPFPDLGLESLPLEDATVPSITMASNCIQSSSTIFSQTVSPVGSTCRSSRIRFSSLHTLDNVLTVSSTSMVLGTCHFRFIYRRMHRLLRPTFKGSFDEYLFYPRRYMYPTPSRYWQSVAKHKFFFAPTAFRLLR